MTEIGRRTTIADFFKLNRTQYDLDFFDAFIKRDTPLFIDPWAIRCGDDEFSVSCYQKIQSVFEKLISLIQAGDKENALDLLDNLHEPRETGLGYSKKTKDGSSVGPEKSEDIYNALLRSKAVASGLLTDLEDTALHIENLGSDNVSDIVTNIIRYDLIKYTQEQCDLYGIEMTQTQTKVFWDESAKDFIQKNNERLLVVEGKKLLLVPKKILRRNLLISYSDFYQKKILEFEQARHLDARTSLCRTLKDKKHNGEVIFAKPFKKTLEKDRRYTLSRDLVFNYIENYPKLLREYKSDKSGEALNLVGNEGILRKQHRANNLEESVKKKIKLFQEIKPGNEYADGYHNHILNCLNTIFNDPESENYLSGPKKEDPQNGGRKKIDITFSNSSNKGFFSNLAKYGNAICAKIFFECKNYTDDIKNPEYDQMAGRFNNRESSVGYIVCRDIEDKEKSLKTRKDYLLTQKGYIFVLTDEDIITLLNATYDQSRDTIINTFLQKKMNELVNLEVK